MTTFVCANLTDFLYSISATIRSTDDENTEGQIDFLNSVIVDMQRKNDQLAAKMELLESAGNDPNIFLIFKNVISLICYFLFTGILETVDFADMAMLNGIDTNRVAPRLFCDICDEFDIHDTEDCPTQGL